MNWIKRNYDQFSLGVVALILLGLSGYLISNAMSFQELFEGIKGQAIHHNNVPPVDMSGIQGAQDAMQNPANWSPGADEGSLFVSVPYVVVSGSLENPDTKNARPLHPPVPNRWVTEHHLNIFDNNILNEDPSGTGFSVLDDYLNVKGDGSDSLDPNDKGVHPPYYTKLKLVKYIKVPFRLILKSWTGKPANPETLDFQINTVDVNDATKFVKIGDAIEGTKFKVISFQEKYLTDPGTGGQKDVSELTVQNTVTGENIILVLDLVADSPDSYAQFEYLWNSSQLVVKKGQEFHLPPESNLTYKLIDITDTKAQIQLPTGQTVWVPLLSDAAQAGQPAQP